MWCWRLPSRSEPSWAERALQRQRARARTQGLPAAGAGHRPDSGARGLWQIAPPSSHHYHGGAVDFSGSADAMKNVSAAFRAFAERQAAFYRLMLLGPTAQHAALVAQRERFAPYVTWTVGGP
jgi:hypothetical protein